MTKTGKNTDGTDGTVDKAQRFKEAATRRTNAALTAIKKIGRLATNNYSYDDSQIDLIVSAIRDELRDTEQSLRARKVSDDGGFQL